MKRRLKKVPWWVWLIAGACPFGWTYLVYYLTKGDKR